MNCPRATEGGKMPHTTSSARKRVRQNEKRRLGNKAAKSGIKGAVRKLTQRIAEGNKEEAQKLLLEAIKKIDKAAGKGIIHRNAARRKISGLTLKTQKGLGEK